jgi:hypothetical protein
MHPQIPPKCAKGRRGSRRFAAALAALTLIASPGASGALAAQDIVVPVAVQIPILVKILSFNRTLTPHEPGQLVIGVVYQSRYQRSATVADEVRRAVRSLPKNALPGLEPRVVGLDLDDTADLAAALARERVVILYVSPLRAVEISELTSHSRPLRITTLTGVPQYVEAGLAVGLDSKGDRPQILINLAAARAEGADFDAQLLKLARLVDREELRR